MAESKAIEAIGFMKERLQETGLNIEKIILFGSQANGEATEESDIDIIVVSRDFCNKDIFKRARLTKEAEILTIRKFMIPFDILTMTPEELEGEDSLLSDYAREGDIVYATQMERGDYASAPQVRAKNNKWVTHKNLKKEPGL
jgi:predicted nucleotidyltransferase